MFEALNGALPEALLAAVFGLIIGSFLNVCIYRMPRDLSVVTPRSFCPSCEKLVAWYDNIPILSYLFLGAKCRHCKAPISWRYPAVELFTALLFFAAFARLGANAQAVKLCVFSAMMAGLIFMDLESFILADEFTLGGTAAGWVLSLFLPISPFLAHWFLPDTWKESYLNLGESLIGSLLPSLVLWGIGELYYRFRGREGLGFGDVKMIAAVGAFYGLNAALQTLVLGSVAGSLLGIVFVVITRKDASTYELPFGSFLGVAALIPPFVFPEIAETLGRGIVVPW